MTAIVGVFAVLSLFCAGLMAGWRAAVASRNIDEHIARFNTEHPRVERFLR